MTVVIVRFFMVGNFQPEIPNAQSFPFRSYVRSRTLNKSRCIKPILFLKPEYV